MGRERPPQAAPPGRPQRPSTRLHGRLQPQHVQRSSSPCFHPDTADIHAGEELEAFIKEHGPFDRIVYTGDGSNDFCPILRLRRSVSHLSNYGLFTPSQPGHCMLPPPPRPAKAHQRGRRETRSQGTDSLLGRRMGGRRDL